MALLRYSSQTQFEFVFLSLSRKRIQVKMVIYILSIFKHKIMKQWKQYNAEEFSLLKQLFFWLLTVFCFPSKACAVLGKYEDQEQLFSNADGWLVPASEIRTLTHYTLWMWYFLSALCSPSFPKPVLLCPLRATSRTASAALIAV